MSSLDPGTRTGFEEVVNTLVSETANHLSMVACGVWRVAPRAASSVNILREVRIPDTTRT